MFDVLQSGPKTVTDVHAALAAELSAENMTVLNEKSIELLLEQLQSLGLADRSPAVQ